MASVGTIYFIMIMQLIKRKNNVEIILKSHTNYLFVIISLTTYYIRKLMVVSDYVFLLAQSAIVI